MKRFLPLITVPVLVVGLPPTTLQKALPLIPPSGSGPCPWHEVLYPEEQQAGEPGGIGGFAVNAGSTAMRTMVNVALLTSWSIWRLTGPRTSRRKRLVDYLESIGNEVRSGT